MSSDDLDATLAQTLTMLTTALDGRVGEIWLRGGETSDVELRYSSSDGTPDVAAFEAGGRALGLGAGPSLVSRVVKTGRGSAAASMFGGGFGGRVTEAAAADIHSALTFPIRGRRGLLGVLAVFRESSARSQSAPLASMPAICHSPRTFHRTGSRRGCHPRSRYGLGRHRVNGRAHRPQEPARVRSCTPHHSATPVRRALARRRWSEGDQRPRGSRRRRYPAARRRTHARVCWCVAGT